jgi:hypothetical protein
LGANWYYGTGNYRYIQTAAASYLKQTSGAFQFFTAPSGTAGNAISFTQAMTLDASGNLGVGSTSPSTYGKMVVEGSGSFTNALVSTSSTLTDKPTLEFRKTMNVTSGQTNTVGRISFNGKWGTTQGEQAYISLTSLNASGVTDSNTLKLSTKSIYDSGNDQSSLTLQGSGFILSTNNAGLVQIVNTTLTLQAVDYRFKADASTEYARFTNTGEFYIAGTTDQGAYNLQVNGTGVWGAGAYVNGSDARLKEDVQDLAPALDVIAALRPVTFRYKEDYSKDRSTQPGFIAQELQQAMQDQAYVDGVVHSGPEFLNVAYQSLVPLLTKAIQEQQAIINQLKARLDAANL